MMLIKNEIESQNFNRKWKWGRDNAFTVLLLEWRRLTAKFWRELECLIDNLAEGEGNTVRAWDSPVLLLLSFSETLKNIKAI
jgi:hypothetical protein